MIALKSCLAALSLEFMLTQAMMGRSGRRRAFRQRRARRASRATSITSSSMFWYTFCSLSWNYIGLLPQGHRDKTGLCCGMEQPRMCLQCSGWNLAGNPPLRKSCSSWSKLLGCLHQPRQCPEGGQDLWQVQYSEILFCIDYVWFLCVALGVFWVIHS